VHVLRGAPMTRRASTASGQGEVSSSPTVLARDLASWDADFLSVLTHEVRGALSTMRVTIELLQNREVMGSPEAPKLISHLDRSVSWVEALIENTAWAARPMDPTTLYRTSISILDAIEPAVSLVAPLLARREQALNLACPTPAPCVHGDATRLSQVVTNLLSNASVYSPKRETIEIDVSSTNAHVCVRIADHGPGLRREEQKKVFNRYIRGSAAAVAGTDGFGLGLYLAKSLVEAHAGAIGVESEPGRGATFWFKLPRR